MEKNFDKKKMEKEAGLMVPLKIFENRDIGVLESLVEYLKDEQGMRFSDIAKILNRHYNTIRTSYVKAKQKK
jgi:predicted transcriptional regulator